MTDAPKDLFGFPRRLLLPLLLIHREHAKHHAHGPLTNHHRPKQAQSLSDSHEHDVVYQHEIDERQHTIAMRVRRSERRVRHGDGFREIIKKSRRDSRAKRERQQHTVKLPKAKTQDPARNGRGEQPAHFDRKPDETEGFAHVVLGVEGQQTRPSKSDDEHPLRRIELGRQPHRAARPNPFRRRQSVSVKLSVAPARVRWVDCPGQEPLGYANDLGDHEAPIVLKQLLLDQ